MAFYPVSAILAFIFKINQAVYTMKPLFCDLQTKRTLHYKLQTCQLKSLKCLRKRSEVNTFIWESKAHRLSHLLLSQPKQSRSLGFWIPLEYCKVVHMVWILDWNTQGATRHWILLEQAMTVKSLYGLPLLSVALPKSISTHSLS